jgi:DNA-binding transcriptional regulator LsrR (DeoR family)
MTETITSDQVLEAAQGLGQDEFTRGDLAEKLGVEKPEIRKGFRQARQSGRLEKVRDDEENTGWFRLTDQ